MFLIGCMALASAGPLRDAGEVGEGPAALVVVTPGVHASAYDGWIEAIEDRGMDAWLFEMDPGLKAEAMPALLAQAAAHLTEQRGAVRVAAHGWGGVYALTAGVEAEHWALIGVPLAAQPVAGPLEGPRWPWPQTLVGELPHAAAPEGSLAIYRGWVAEFPSYPPPTSPTLLIASGMDVVAPPEVVRLPSQGWSQRTWERAGFLSLSGADPTHAELLQDAGVARRVAKFLEEGE